MTTDVKLGFSDVARLPCADESQYWTLQESGVVSVFKVGEVVEFAKVREALLDLLQSNPILWMRKRKTKEGSEVYLAENRTLDVPYISYWGISEPQRDQIFNAALLREVERRRFMFDSSLLTVLFFSKTAQENYLLVGLHQDLRQYLTPKKAVEHINRYVGLNVFGPAGIDLSFLLSDLAVE
ncbi:hypothetical protein [Chitinimonas lacunae]|uniref:Uncharacterized protein n=1 Tax=Chitinimonas lacunae TaxID=1963018 RepID=A0ABV8MS24_9NEIS